MKPESFDRFKDLYTLITNQIGGAAVMAAIGLGASQFVTLEIVQPSEEVERVHDGE